MKGKSKMSNLYNGSSEGFENLVTGYIDYAEEVITARAIPDLYDGLKPVHRRILTSAQGLKFNNGLLKSANLVGATLALNHHPLQRVSSCKPSYL